MHLKHNLKSFLSITNSPNSQIYTLLWRLVTLLPGLRTAVGARIEVRASLQHFAMLHWQLSTSCLNQQQVAIFKY